MITEKDFEKAIKQNIPSASHYDLKEAAAACFELAKKMAKDFADWLAANDYKHLVDDWWFSIVSGKRRKLGELFNEWQSSQNETAIDRENSRI